MPNLRTRPTRPAAQNHHRARRVRRMHDGVFCSCPSRISGRSSPQDLRADLRGEAEESEMLRDDHELVICVSGGKDSSALALWLFFESGLGNPKHLVFCDTGHENPVTIKHVNDLAIRLGKPLNIATSGFSFVELCEKKQRFPSTRARFCTEELKVKPTAKWLEYAVDTGLIEGKPVVVQGIRADESSSRSQLPEWQDENKGYGPGQQRSAYDCPIWRPILKWSAQDVFDCHKRHSFEPNHLYKLGVKRVGCWPCIHSGRADLRAAFEADPGLLDRLREYERRVSEASKRGANSFFASNKTPHYYHDKVFTNEDGQSWTYASIDAIHRWVFGNDAQAGLFDEFEAPACFSQYGLCE